MPTNFERWASREFKPAEKFVLMSPSKPKTPAQKLLAAAQRESLEHVFTQRWRQYAQANAIDLSDGPKPQFGFHATRKWKFDFAWPAVKVAVEIEGGQWVGGRHQRGRGYQGDCEKYNAAALAGWLVLRFTGDDLKKRPWQCCELVKRALARKA